MRRLQDWQSRKHALLPPGFPYLTFFPSIVVLGFVFGLLPALTCAFLCIVAAWYWLIPPYGFALDMQAATAIVSYVIVVTIEIGLLQLTIRAVKAQVRATEALRQSLELQRVVSGEIDHRLKNVFAMLTGLVALSHRFADTPKDLATQLRERIASMSRSVDLLRGAADGRPVELRRALASSLEAVGSKSSERIEFEGEDRLIRPDCVIPLNLSFHELATNSMKYGALSCEDGIIHVRWHIEERASGRSLCLKWRELRGPQPKPPERTGFGTVLVGRMSEYLGGSSDMVFEPSGLRAILSFSCSRLLSSDAA